MRAKLDTRGRRLRTGFLRYAQEREAPLLIAPLRRYVAAEGPGYARRTRRAPAAEEEIVEERGGPGYY